MLKAWQNKQSPPKQASDLAVLSTEVVEGAIYRRQKNGKADGMKADELLQSGISKYRQKKYEEAIEYLNQVISLNPNCTKAYHYRAMLHVRQEKKRRAIEDLQQAVILLDEREYTAIGQNVLELIEKFLKDKEDELEEYTSQEKDELDQENDSLYPDFWIDEDGHWIEYDENEIHDWVEEDFSWVYWEEFFKLELWLSRRLERAEALQLKRTENAQFDKDRLQSNGLPLCNSHEAIAEAMGISIKELRFLAFYRKKSHYISFQIPKKTGGKRDISAPRLRLKQAQEWILHNILEKLEPHEAAHGFRRERSIVTNAQPHVGAQVIINVDLKDFFPSISYKRVKGLFKSFGYSETASIIFGLMCTEPKVKQIELDGKTDLLLSWTERRLPQGAPTSPSISNLLCRRLDLRLSQMAEQLGLVYTRYADDLTFSASGDSLRNICNVLKRTISIVKYEGFDINEQKTRILHKSRQQEVTGVVVNKKLNVSRETLKRFRATLYQIEKDGLRGKHWGQSKTNDLIASLEGFANFVCMINPEKGANFQESIRRIKEKYGQRQAQVAPVSQPKHQSNVIALIHPELRRLGWSTRKRRGYLRQTYGKQSIQQLTDEDLVEFLHDLKSLPTNSSFYWDFQLTDYCFGLSFGPDSDLIAKTNVQLKQLGWTANQLRQYLSQTYSKRSRLQLTGKEWVEFWSYINWELTTPKLLGWSSKKIRDYLRQRGDVAESELTDFLNALAKTDAVLVCLSWSVEEGQNYLEQTYGKRSRLHLTTLELMEFLEYLKLEYLKLPPPPPIDIDF